jgi:signal transduction histidine kinase
MDLHALVARNRDISAGFSTGSAASRHAIALAPPPNREATRRKSTRRTRSWIRRLKPRRRSYAYSAAVSGLAAALLALFPDGITSTEPAFVPIGAALVAGALLSLRLRAGESGGTLLLVPAIVADARFGAQALAALAFASLIGSLARRVRGAALIASVGHDVLAFGTAHLLAQSLDYGPVARLAAFALVFTIVRVVLGQVAAWFGVAHPRAERPDVLVLLALAPLTTLPLLAGARFGDIGLVLGLAALLAILSVVVEAGNLATSRAEADAERDSLARANSLQRDLMHLITHEIKNPLTAVLVYCELVQRALRTNSTEPVPGHVVHIAEGARSIQRLVDNLLQLSQLEDAEDLPPAEPVDLPELADKVAGDLQVLADRKQLTLDVEIAQPAPPALAAPLLLREALSNLVSNAIKYTPEGGSVRVWARPGGADDTVIVGVTDTGIGIGEVDLQHVFTKFFRSPDPRARKERGSGLGLALTQAIVTRMGGRVEVVSQLHQGTTFSLVLPAAPVSAGGYSA